MWEFFGQLIIITQLYHSVCIQDTVSRYSILIYLKKSWFAYIIIKI